MLNAGEEVIWAGEPELCLKAYRRTPGTIEHPLNQIAAVISAVRKSPLFEHFAYIRAIDLAGRREVPHPVFRLKETQSSDTPSSRT